MIKRLFSVVLVFGAGFCISGASAQQPYAMSGWVLGGSLGLTTSPPAAFAAGMYVAPPDGPYRDYCRRDALVSLGILGGRMVRSWLRTDLVVTGNVEAGSCNVVAVLEQSAPYARVTYVGRTPGYAHVTLVARSIVERTATSGSFHPRLIGGVGCICEKRIPLVQLGAGFTVGSQQNRLAIEAGGQLSRVPWRRHIDVFYFPREQVLRDWFESGTSWPTQLWLRAGLERHIRRRG